MKKKKKYKDKPLYEVPDCYFEQLQRDVMQRVVKEEKRTPKKWISAVSVAASISIIFALSYFLYLNRNTDEHFYVHEEMPLPDNSIISLDSSYLAEATECIIIDTITEEIPTTPKPLSPKAPLVEKETIVYRAVDFYVDDYEINNFCETMYELECYYDY
jgi:hypothetical protein